MITYTPWQIRGYNKPCYQVYVEITKSTTIKELRAVKEILNGNLKQGLYIVENSSPVIKRLGWQKMDDFWYREVY